MAALKIENLITESAMDGVNVDHAGAIIDHIDLWTAAVRPKSSAGRGSNSKLELTGIKKLRELILELAVRGKLVPQDPSDEPASVLLERIAVEKTRLVKEGKIKKPKALPEISEEEKPFELPEGWAWIRFGNIYELEYGDNLPQPMRTNSGEYPVFGSNGVVGTHNVPSVYSPCIVIGRKGSAGALNLNDSAGCWVTDVAYSCVPPFGVDIRFAFKQMHTFGLDSLGKGIKPGLNRNEAYVLVVALPPLAEQHRIVAKVDELMALCDQLELRSESQLAAHQTLVEALLATLAGSTDADELAQNWARLSTHFDTLFTTEASIDALKQTILQLAVMGKLVSQDLSDEPASVLLERIAAEKAQLIREGKIKSEKQYPVISDTELPHSKPDGWVFERFGNVLINRDFERIPLAVSEREKRKGGYDYYGASGVIDKIDGYLFDKPLLLIGEDGANLINRSSPIAFIARGKYWVNNHAHVLDGLNEDLLKYVCLHINAMSLLPYITGTAQPKMNQAKMNAIVLGIPPLAEQKRIVAKVDELMALCDQLTSRLQTSQQTQLALAESLVEGALA